MRSLDRQLKFSTLLIASGAVANARPALADWGEDWGTMVWGSGVAPVPGLEGVGLGALVLALVLAGAFMARRRFHGIRVPLLLVVAAIPLAVAAGTVAVPHNFIDGTPALADQVNANFDAVETAVNDNDSRMTAVEGALVNSPFEVGLDSGNLPLILNGDEVGVEGGHIFLRTHDTGAVMHTRLEVTNSLGPTLPAEVNVTDAYFNVEGLPQALVTLKGPVNGLDAARLQLVEDTAGGLGGYLKYDGFGNSFSIGSFSSVGADIDAISINRGSADVAVLGGLTVGGLAVQARISGTCSVGSAISAIAGDGSVTCVNLEPDNVSFFASNSLDDVLPAQSWFKIDFDSEDHDDSNNYSSDTFTAPTAGVYQLNATVSFQGVVSGDYMEIRIVKQSGITSRYYRGHVSFAGGAAASYNMGVSLRLEAGETAHVEAWSGAQQTIRGSVNNALYTWFSGHRIY